MQPGDRNGVVLGERGHDQPVTKESLESQVRVDILWVLAEFAELAKRLSKIDGANRGAAQESVLNPAGARLLVEVGEKRRCIENG